MRPAGEAGADAHDALCELRAQTAGSIAARTHDFIAVVQASLDANVDDEHDPEGSTIAFERAQLVALLDSARDALDEIDSALDRVAIGTYGRCEQCGLAIGAERLRARPAVRHCVDCAGSRRPSAAS